MRFGTKEPEPRKNNYVCRYPKACGIAALVFANIKQYLETVLKIPVEDVPELTLRYYSSHGTTLAGLVVSAYTSINDCRHDTDRGHRLSATPGGKNALHRQELLFFCPSIRLLQLGLLLRPLVRVALHVPPFWAHTAHLHFGHI